METLESVLALMFSVDSLQRRRLREERMDAPVLAAPELRVPLSCRTSRPWEEDIGRHNYAPSHFPSLPSSQKTLFFLSLFCKVSICPHFNNLYLFRDGVCKV